MYRKDTIKIPDLNKRYKDTRLTILEFIHLLKVETYEKDNMCTKDYTLIQFDHRVAKMEEDTNKWKNHIWRKGNKR